jgi:hypothetical protein
VALVDADRRGLAQLGDELLPARLGLVALPQLGGACAHLLRRPAAAPAAVVQAQDRHALEQLHGLG